MQLVVPLDPASNVPLYRQVVEGLKSMVTTGKLTAGQKLPSSRELAETLAISRFTASKAYEELARLGYIETQPASGTFVSESLPEVRVFSPQAPASTAATHLSADRLSDYGERISSSPDIEPADVELSPELNYCAAAPEQLPIGKWQEMLIKASRARDYRTYVSDFLGHQALREALADYLNRTRGLRCSSEQIAVFSGSQPALDLVTHLIINPGDTAVVENPGFPGARRTFSAYGAELLPVPVDNEGLKLDKLKRDKIKPKVLYATPSHHDPTGVALSLNRRKELLEWAGENKVWIIEDDFDSEFRYGEKPTPALQGSDEGSSVIYLSAFWKIMFPVLRLGFVVLPPCLLPIMHRAKSLVDRDFHFVEHEAFTHFIREGHLERHLRKIKRVYADRRQFLIAALHSQLGTQVRISPVGSGTHLFVRFDDELDEQRILDAASRAALPMVSTHAYYLRDPAPNEMLIPFAHINEQQIDSGISRFAEYLSDGGKKS